MQNRGLQHFLLICLMPAFLSGCTDQNAANPKSIELDMQVQQLHTLLDEIKTPNEPEQGELLVQLVFGSEADLDLYVTDPLLETVYFANNKSRSGGEINKDLKCDAGELRVEEVRFRTPLPGRYRVGVDFPEFCHEKGEPAAYLILATHNGKTEEAAGSVLLQQFNVIAMEFDVGKTDVNETDVNETDVGKNMDDKSRVSNEI
jgi:hypothetical protein